MWLAALTFAVVSHSVAVAGAGLLLRLPVEELAFGLGPGVAVRLRPLGMRPRFVLGGYVAFTEPEQLTAGQRVLLALAGVVPALVLATFFLGSGVLPELWQAVVDLLAARSPTGLAQVALADAHACYRDAPTRFAALLLVKVAAWNLLPLPHVGIGQALAMVLPLRLRERLTIASVLLALVWLVLWMVAIGVYVL